MTSEGFDYATDNDPTLEYKKKLGSGGFGTVHEVSRYSSSGVADS